MRARARRRAALGMVLSAAVAGSLAVVGAPAYGQQSQSSGVGNSGTANASTGGNSSAGNSSSNAAGNAYSQTSPPTTSVPVLGSVLGLVLNLSTGSGNASDGTSNVSTGPAAAAGNTSDTSASQTKASAPGGGGGSPIVLGSIFNPFINPFFVPPPDQSAGVTNSGAATASTGGNSGVGNNSSNAASNTQTVNGGLIGIGLQLGNTASNTSNGTSNITTGGATASGNQSTTAVDQTRIDGRGGPGGPFGTFGAFGIGGGVACDGFFRFGGQRVDVGNTGTARADTGGNASVGNQSQNIARNDSSVTGGLINLNVPGLLSNTATNASNGTSNIATGAATASGNRSTTSVDQACIEPVRVASPPPIRPGVVIQDGFRIGVGGPNVQPGVQVRPQQLARTGRDPFVMGLVAFALLFGGLMFLVWERVESYPKRTA